MASTEAIITNTYLAELQLLILDIAFTPSTSVSSHKLQKALRAPWDTFEFHPSKTDSIPILLMTAFLTAEQWDWKMQKADTLRNPNI